MTFMYSAYIVQYKFAILKRMTIDVKETVVIWKYCIRPNYRTVRLGFSNLQDTLICGQICIYLLRIHYKKRSEKDLFNDDYAIFSDFLYKGICCGYSFELHRLVDAIQMSTHNICLCKEEKSTLVVI